MNLNTGIEIGSNPEEINVYVHRKTNNLICFRDYDQREWFTPSKDIPYENGDLLNIKVDGWKFIECVGLRKPIIYGTQSGEISNILDES